MINHMFGGALKHLRSFIDYAALEAVEIDVGSFHIGVS